MSTTIERPETIAELEWVWPSSAEEEDPVLRVLRLTETILCERGWIKGVAEAEDGRVCLVGALCYAAREVDRKIYQKALREIRSVIWVPHRSVPRWNDRPWRREAAVHRVIGRAIKRREKHLLSRS